MNSQIRVHVSKCTSMQGILLTFSLLEEWSAVANLILREQ